MCQTDLQTGGWTERQADRITIAIAASNGALKLLFVLFLAMNERCGLQDESQHEASRHQCCCARRLDCWKGRLVELLRLAELLVKW